MARPKYAIWQRSSIPCASTIDVTSAISSSNVQYTMFGFLVWVEEDLLFSVGLLEEDLLFGVGLLEQDL
ncbi:hypothetical protein Hanom_Chr16g01426291 [Helianthus anomalus]